MIVSEMYELCSAYDEPLRSRRSLTGVTPQGTAMATQDLLYQREEVRIIVLFLLHLVDMKII
jgi:hypothetical protein